MNICMYSLISSIGCSSNFVLVVVGSSVQKGFVVHKGIVVQVVGSSGSYV